MSRSSQSGDDEELDERGRWHRAGAGRRVVQLDAAIADLQHDVEAHAIRGVREALAAPVVRTRRYGDDVVARAVAGSFAAIRDWPTARERLNGAPSGSDGSVVELSGTWGM